MANTELAATARTFEIAATTRTFEIAATDRSGLLMLVSGEYGVMLLGVGELGGEWTA